MIETKAHGSVDGGFESVRAAFEENFQSHGEKGAACCVYVHGKKVIDLWGGTYTPETLQMVMSSTKGVVAVAAHMLAEEGSLDFDAPVTVYWPEFAAEGKHDMPVRWLFSHRAGLPAIDRQLSVDDVFQWDPVVDALAAQRPLWQPNTGHGYHVGTFGWLAGEVIRRVTGTSVGAFVAERISRPLGLDLWIGLPEGQEPRVAPILAAPPPAPGTPVDVFTARLLDPTTLLHRAFVNPPLPASIFNERAFHAAEIPAANGITSARSLARMYAACIGEVDGVRLLGPDTVAGATRVQSAGEDIVLGYETRYATGFQLSFPFRPMAGEGSFGHYGMGGSVGFALPQKGLAFAYAMNQMLPSGGVDPRTKSLIGAVLASL
ncbi:MAG TPA: serine hydrolase domain-containing protein [Candidatus Dormibacteraeota bacterium]|nr:serine hydrolase domain-containing protein [Candidatus Dormibacteraeota bacterium]